MSRRKLRASESVIAELGDRQALAKACAGIDCVYHCAGYAHAFPVASKIQESRHWSDNFEGTRNLAEVAGRSGVKRFVFLSSVKAMPAPGDLCVDESCQGAPDSVYGKAKRAAEDAVLEAGALYGMNVVNLRLAMVYGSGGKGNLERMGAMVRRQLFPPIPETGNHRSLVHVDDVVSAMRFVANDVRAAGQTYIIANQEAPSGRQLYDALRVAHGLAPCRWSVPITLLKAAASLGDGVKHLLHLRFPFDSEILARLLTSAWYSHARIEQELGWRANVLLKDGLLEMLHK